MLAGTYKRVGANNAHGLYCAFPEAKLSNMFVNKLGITQSSQTSCFASDKVANL